MSINTRVRRLFWRYSWNLLDFFTTCRSYCQRNVQHLSWSFFELTCVCLESAGHVGKHLPCSSFLKQDTESLLAWPFTLTSTYKSSFFSMEVNKILKWWVPVLFKGSSQQINVDYYQLNERTIVIESYKAKAKSIMQFRKRISEVLLPCL